jgi:hypothetical protein
LTRPGLDENLCWTWHRNSATIKAMAMPMVTPLMHDCYLPLIIKRSKIPLRLIAVWEKEDRS